MSKGEVRGLIQQDFSAKNYSNPNECCYVSPTLNNLKILAELSIWQATFFL